MSKLNDLTGKRFGRLTVVGMHEKAGKHIKWLCKCDCGKETIVYACNLTKNHTLSCGCFHKEISKEVFRKNFLKHGLSKTRIHKIWSGMIERCYSHYAQNYKDYGGRGIKVCEEWKNSFMSFYEWSMENGYKEGLSIDRIDVNGNYEPDNCRWATHSQQSNNRRNNYFIYCNGDVKTEAEWSKQLGAARGTVKKRIKNGWSIEEAVSIPPGKVRNNQYKNKKRSRGSE